MVAANCINVLAAMRCQSAKLPDNFSTFSVGGESECSRKVAYIYTDIPLEITFGLDVMNNMARRPRQEPENIEYFQPIG